MISGQLTLLQAGFETIQIIVEHLVFIEIFHDQLDEVSHFLLYGIKHPLIGLAGIHYAGIFQV
jgi:hypothetical protein